MNQHVTKGSLIERAAEVYGLGMAVPAAPAPTKAPQTAPRQPEPVAPEIRRASVDRARLRAAGFIDPDAPVSGLAEEFRIIKRQLLLGVRDEGTAADKRRAILVCSASSGEGKTFCAVNLALSMAGETEVEVLLVDGDVNKPGVLAALGLEPGPGMIDALAGPGGDPEAFVIHTDVPGLSVLPAGRHVNNATELLSSPRAVELLARLTARRPNRIVIFDSPPALMASPASVLAAHVGQAVMVVRADRTTEAELREAVALLSGCPNLSLLLNAAAFSAPGRRFGTYYGYGQ